MDSSILKKIFDEIQNEVYCVIKLEESALGKKGGDVDMYCTDVSKLGKKILHTGNSLIAANTYDSIKLTENKELKHIYVDFYANGQLDFRFDIFGKLPFFKTIDVKKEFFSDCLTKRIKKTIGESIEQYSLYTPEKIHDLLTRYLEFIEYYPERQDKNKHLAYVAHALADEAVRISFLSSLSFYVLKRKPEIPKDIFRIKKIIHFGKRVVRKIKRIIFGA